MPRHSLLLCLAILTLLATSDAVAQDLLYDDGGDHVLSSYGSLTDSSTIEVRDGPGADPTTLDITIGNDTYYLIISSYGSSVANLVALGYGDLNTYNDSRGTVQFSANPNLATYGARSWDHSQVLVNNQVNETSANHDSTMTFGTGSLSNRHQGFNASTTIVLDGFLVALDLWDTAVLNVLGGRAGGDYAIIRDDSYVNVDGGRILFSGGGLIVQDRARVDIHSGAANAVDDSLSVSSQGIVQLFGTDFLLDGTPIGPGDITALAGGATRSGTLAGILESGDALEIDFTVQQAGVIRIVPEPTAVPALGPVGLVALALALTLAAAMRIRGAAA
jgi:hypothetical protein